MKKLSKYFFIAFAIGKANFFKVWLAEFLKESLRGIFSPARTTAKERLRNLPSILAGNSVYSV